MDLKSNQVEFRARSPNPRNVTYVVDEIKKLFPSAKVTGFVPEFMGPGARGYLLLELPPAEDKGGDLAYVENPLREEVPSSVEEAVETLTWAHGPYGAWVFNDKAAGMVRYIMKKGTLFLNRWGHDVFVLDQGRVVYLVNDKWLNKLTREEYQEMAGKLGLRAVKGENE
jgi:hypothetical protein